MTEFWFQLLSGAFLFIITGILGFMALQTWKATNKIAVFDERFKTVGEDISKISKDIEEVRKYDATLVRHTFNFEAIERRLVSLEHPKRPVRI